MDHPLFETPRPPIGPAEAEVLVRDVYGIDGAASPLAGERDTLFRIDSAGGSFALRVGNSADDADAVEMQVRAMEHAKTVDPSLPIPDAVRTIDGDVVGHHHSPQGPHALQLVSFMPGLPADRADQTPGFRRSIGSTVGRLSRALVGFDHPALRRHLLWDVARLPELTPMLAHVGKERRARIRRCLDEFKTRTLPDLQRLRAQAVYGDAHAGNLLVDPADRETVSGLVDFGDMTHGATALEVAIAVAYQTFGDDPIRAMVQVVSAFHAVYPLLEAEIAMVPALARARLAQSYLISAWRSTVDPENRDYILSDSESAWSGIVTLDALDAGEVTADLLGACGLSRPTRRTMTDALALRAARLGPALSLSYAEPVRLESGEGVWLFDTDGNRLLDAYNNVPHVGHGHPLVANAVAAQIHHLTTNTRYLVDEVAEYADRLAGLFPDELSVVMFVNSGSEANDVAYQIARAVTGNRGVVVSEHAYHGTTWATSSMSPEEIGWDRIEPWTAHVGGSDTLVSPDASERVTSELISAFDRLAATGERPAMVIFDDVFSSDGIHTVPSGYLRAAYAAARRAGALCVADEVQAGFGRVGVPFWGFALDGAVPDIVTLGKPMGNGHPIGAVVTRPDIAREFASNWHFFSTFAGSPVAAAAGTAVLDVLDREGLPERAETVGEYLRSRLRHLGHPSIVDVRGPGLFVGVEMTNETAAAMVVEGMRRSGVLIGRTGANGNVLKIRPPLVFSERHADLLVDRLATVLRNSMVAPED